MATIVRACAPLLHGAGFKKRRHAFNRATSDGLVHVVNFWMAPFEPPAWTEVPGLRERLYGNFRLDFGVWVPEMNRSGAPRTSWVNEYDCQLRRTIGRLMTGDDASDLWWPIDAAGAARAMEGLMAHGLPWLEGFPSKATVLERFEAVGALAIGLSPAGALDIADLYEALGQSSDARRTLEHYVGRPVLGNHAGYLRGYLEERGHADLAMEITTRLP